MTGLSAHTLRYYERAGLVEPVARDAGGRRRYSAEEAEWIRFLKYLRTTGMPIHTMRRYAELRREGPKTIEEHHREVKERLEELGRNLRAIEEKIRYCKDREASGGRSDGEAHRLGDGGFEVSALGLGCMGMSEFYGATDEREAVGTIRKALELGVTFLDTAADYGLGDNECLVGRAIADRRDEVMLATKFGIARSPESPRASGMDGRPENARRSCDTSLRRLGVDQIDLYYQHRVDPNTPVEETWGAMKELVEAGKVRHLGISEASAATIKRAHAVHPVTALQTGYSLWSREVEDEVLPLCRQLGIGFVAYSPLGRGFLTGAIKSPDDFDEDDFRRSSPRFRGENFRKNLRLVGRVREIAGEKGVTPGQLALAWLLYQGEDVVPIPGTKRREYLEENAGATDVELADEDIRRIGEVVPKGAAAGDRYPEAMMGALDR